MVPTRPLTHDLFKQFAISFSIKITEIVIYNLQEGIFYSKIVCEHNGVYTEIDARTSDAIAIGVRFNCPIFTFESILSSAGIVLDESNELSNELAIEQETEEPQSNSLLDLSSEELEDQLNAAIDNEDYELASKIRDEINKRSK